MSIFAAHPPADPHSLAEGKERQSHSKGQHDALLNDLVANKDQVCVASGKALRDAPSVRCKTCKHSMIAAELAPQQHACPLCHGPLPSQEGGSRGRGSLKQSRVIEGVH
eukprot:GHRR01030396.1.p1 GENE.GHRR01030396.1~~GHRR01030396.1.p1  ORF type:complete len:109 (+),score=25.07 GHRR01030396.1:630-956(+)